MADETIHYLKSDDRFCGDVPKGVTRRISPLDEQITCPNCLAKDAEEWPVVIS